MMNRDSAKLKYKGNCRQEMAIKHPNKACKTRKYGYRAGFMKAKRCVCQHDEDETAATDETPPMDETHNEDR